MDQKNELWGSQTFGGEFMKKLLAQPASILLVLWGWAQFLGYFRFFMVRILSLSFATTKTLEYLTNGITILVLLYTINYLWMHRIWFKKPEVKTITTIWIALFFSMVSINLIQQNVLHHVVFELQHALFMLITGLAILLTGSVIRSNWMLIGGIAFALLAYGASFMVLKNQMMLEAIGWILGFVVPGHVLLRRSKSN